ncbi:hypothetical protein VTK73DRAFT_651 [Phialemonium thermophilum]|uniref:Zn(2)-C6 fungal-type domain-containing protein n=1 Tax=Phialemonium thermophilum TaxID=223376 RepID=A0ABR3VUL9_9PEZI
MEEIHDPVGNIDPLEPAYHLPQTGRSVFVARVARVVSGESNQVLPFGDSCHTRSAQPRSQKTLEIVAIDAIECLAYTPRCTLGDAQHNMYTREKTNGAANGAGEHDDVSGAEDDDFQEQTDLQDQDTSRKKSVAKDEGPACQSCRRKKAKCTRRQPCSQCVRYNVECVYDDKRTKPGMRTGAIETLSQRVGE